LNNNGHRKKLSILLLKNLIFNILLPGIVTGLLPYYIAFKGIVALVPSLTFTYFGGLILSFAGLIVLISCILNFTINGKGTLPPTSPTKKLVTTGFYRFSRNSMYVGVLCILTGETLFALSLSLLTYTTLVFICFNFFIILREEPHLKSTFKP